MRTSFAWVPPGTAWSLDLDREDERVYSFSISQTEGEFPTLTVDVRNPHIGLLNVARDVWAWLGIDDGSSAGLQPAFFGRLVGIPQQLTDDLVQLALIARPDDWDAQRAELAAAMKIAPFWDPLWIDAANRADPDSALEARTELWHIERTSLLVTASDSFAGEDGTIDFAGDFFADSLNVGYSQPPVRRVAVTGTVSWNQVATGTVDFSGEILAAAGAASSRQGSSILTMTGQGLIADWPQPGSTIGGGWTVGESSGTRTDGAAIPAGTVEVIHAVAGTISSFPRWAVQPVYKADYSVSRGRTEVVSFVLEADCQAMLTEPGDGEVITLTPSSSDVDSPIDPPSSARPEGELPIGDQRRAAYFTTPRGKQSLEFLIALARSQLLMRARAVEIGFEVELQAALSVSCRKNARIADGRLPGGEATGKIIGYTLTADGDTGQMSAQIRIGCMVGNGNTVTESAGTPDYVEDGYVEDGYQTRTGAVIMPIAGEVTYTDFDNTPNGDDGLNFFDMRPAALTDAVSIADPYPTQLATLQQIDFFYDDKSAVAALAQLYTQITVDLKQIDGGPFETDYAVTVSQLMVPKTIDLAAGSTP